MPLTDSGVQSLTATDKMQKKGVGNYLYVVVEPSKNGGGKSIYPFTARSVSRQGVADKRSGSAYVLTALLQGNGP